jgi:2-iminoacetate synthase ThiH
VQILMQGGHNPYLPLDWYLDLLRYIKEHHPIHVHGFSASEVEMMAKVSKLPVDEVLRSCTRRGSTRCRARARKCWSMPCATSLRRRRSTHGRWLEIHEAAHEVGMLTTATLMYGVGETWEDRLEHLLKLRASQARSLARGAGRFTAFITWSFQPSHTEMQDWQIELGTAWTT